MLIGRFLGSQSSAKFRMGAWFGTLSRGPNTRAFDSTFDAVGGAPSAHIGVGSGVLSDIGAELTLGDYDLAFGFLSDQLFAPANEALEGIDNRLAATVLKQLFGELRTRALGHIFGSEVWVRVVSGNFEGPLEAERFGVRDGEVWFGGRDAVWRTAYFSAEAGAENKPFDFDVGTYLRYTRFSMPTALQLNDASLTDPFALQTATLNALGFGLRWSDSIPISFLDLDLSASMIPFTGLAAVSYGAWGTAFGLLAEGDARATLAVNIPLGGLMAIRPYVGFELRVVLPVTLSIDLTDLAAPSVALPDYYLWGPQVGVEVRL